MNSYLIFFESEDLLLSQSGFDVCLAILSLELPFNVVVSETVFACWQQRHADLIKQLQSLSDFEEIGLYLLAKASADPFKALSEPDFVILKKNTFILSF